MTTTAPLARHRGYRHAAPFRLEARSVTTEPIETYGRVAVIYLTPEGDFLRDEIIEVVERQDAPNAC